MHAVLDWGNIISSNKVYLNCLVFLSPDFGGDRAAAKNWLPRPLGSLRESKTRKIRNDKNAGENKGKDDISVFLLDSLLSFIKCKCSLLQGMVHSCCLSFLIKNKQQQKANTRPRHDQQQQKKTNFNCISKIVLCFFLNYLPMPVQMWYSNKCKLKHKNNAVVQWNALWVHT